MRPCPPNSFTAELLPRRFPIAFEPSNDIIGKARKPADDAAAAAKARLGPYTEQFSTQLTQAQTNLHVRLPVASLPTWERGRPQLRTDRARQACLGRRFAASVTQGCPDDRPRRHCLSP